mgnify:CR=1 FL=1
MKTALACLLLLLLACGVRADFHECILGVRTYPLRYVSVTQTVDFRVAFKSNCMDFASLNFFILPYNKDFNLSKNVHPRRIILSVYGRVYQFDFSQPRRKGLARAMNLIYTSVKVLPSKVPRGISTLRGNDVILRTSEVNAFSKKEIDSLYYKKNPCLCKLSKTKKTMFCEI